VNPLELSKAVGALTDEDLRKAAAAQPAARPGVLVRELAAHHRSRLLKHLLALGPDDRLLRFGQTVGDHVIEAYVDSIDFDHDSVFGVYDEKLELIGVGHFANLRDNAQGRVAEFGVSVSASARGRGIGSALFERASKVQYAYGEADAYLELPPADAASRLSEAVDEQMAEFDYMVRRNLRDARRFGLRFWRTLVPQKHTA